MLDNLVVIVGGLVPRGAYDSGTVYDVGDSVSFNGSSYIKYVDSDAGVEPTDTTKWQILVQGTAQEQQGGGGFTSITSLADIPNDPDLVGFWRFNETSGTVAADESANGHDGTASRSAILGNAGGKQGNMGVFARGNSDYIGISDNSLFRQAGPFTIVSWFKTSADTSLNQVMFQSYSCNPNVAGVLLAVEDITGYLHAISGKNTGITPNTDYVKLTSATAVNNGAWHLGIFSYDGNKVYLYLDGNEIAEANWTQNPAYAATSHVRIGCRNQIGTNNAFVEGDLDDVMFFKRCLTTAEKNVIWSGY